MIRCRVFAERPGQEKAFWPRIGVRFGIGIPEVDCADIERFLAQRPRLLSRVGCFANATFFHVDVG